MTTVFVSDPAYTRHNTGPWHPEQPARASVIDQCLIQSGLKTASNSLKPRPAHESELLLCHTLPYLQLVQHEIRALKGTLDTPMLSTGDVVISADSLDIALLAAGGVLTAVDYVMASTSKDHGANAFCIVRPPGHHACSGQGMGFCLFNNAAIAARYAQQRYGVKRVLIADWDVHHGNGTQEIFYQDPTVFYFSTHELGNYPGTGLKEEIGEGAGKGFTLNCPILPSLRSREEVLHAFDVLLRERMQHFQPDLVLISAGFDAHEADPLGHFNLTDQDFFDLTTILKEIADEYAHGRLVSVLEGGYNLQALASASLAHVKSLVV